MRPVEKEKPLTAAAEAAGAMEVNGNENGLEGPRGEKAGNGDGGGGGGGSGAVLEAWLRISGAGEGWLW